MAAGLKKCHQKNKIQMKKSIFVGTKNVSGQEIFRRLNHQLEQHTLPLPLQNCSQRKFVLRTIVTIRGDIIYYGLPTDQLGRYLYYLHYPCFLYPFEPGICSTIHHEPTAENWLILARLVELEGSRRAESEGGVYMRAFRLVELEGSRRAESEGGVYMRAFSNLTAQSIGRRVIELKSSSVKLPLNCGIFPVIFDAFLGSGLR
ncbi:hypothetical protein R3P38DRAFT_2787481 [Favolaschia claudopus]|uniref:Uncharacterized protein n=1 Tax=Favolaschia claudopus TaxID=2862362 RepID=A0AAW0AN37_9AGAR